VGRLSPLVGASRTFAADVLLAREMNAFAIYLANDTNACYFFSPSYDISKRTRCDCYLRSDAANNLQKGQFAGQMTTISPLDESVFPGPHSVQFGESGRPMALGEVAGFRARLWSHLLRYQLRIAAGNPLGKRSCRGSPLLFGPTVRSWRRFFQRPKGSGLVSPPRVRGRRRRNSVGRG